MKKYALLTTTALVMLAVFFTACRSSRTVYVTPPPPPRPSVSLILNTPGPGFVMVKQPRGGYYYRSPQGYIYRRGYGNRYYIDSRYVSRNYHQHQQYNDWRRYHRRR
jgi:hypothetical protein